MRYFCLLCAVAILTCTGCWDRGPSPPSIGKKLSEPNEMHNHSPADVKRMLGFNYEIVEPPDYQSSDEKIDGEQFAIMDLSASGWYAVCQTDNHRLFLWDTDAHTITPLNMANLKYDENCSAGVLNDGRVLTIDPNQLVMILDVNKEPQQLTKLKTESYLSPSRFRAAGDWIMWTDQISWHLWNLNDKNALLPEPIKHKSPRYFDVYGINANGTLAGEDLSTETIAIFNSDRENVVIDVAEYQYELPALNDLAADATDVNDNGFLIGSIYGYDKDDYLVTAPFVSSQGKGLRFLPAEDQISDVHFERINNHGFIVGFCSVNGWQSTLAIWDSQRLGQGAINIKDAIVNTPGDFELFECIVFANDCSILVEVFDFGKNDLVLLRPKR